MPRLKAIFLNSLPCLCLQSSTACTSSWTKVSSTSTGSVSVGDMKIWFLSLVLLLRDQHWPMWWLRVPVLAKPQETMTSMGTVCRLASKWGRIRSTAASSQDSRVRWCCMSLLLGDVTGS